MWLPKCLVSLWTKESPTEIVADRMVPSLQNGIPRMGIAPSPPILPDVPIPAGPISEKSTKYTQLIISYTDGEKIGWSQRPYIGKEVIKPWKHFVQWYWQRKDSDEYMMKYTGGVTLIKRSRIKDFQIKILDENDPKDKEKIL